MHAVLNIGLGIGCLAVGLLMASIALWFSWNGIKEKDKVSVFFGLAILAVAVFALISAYNMFTKL